MRAWWCAPILLLARPGAGWTGTDLELEPLRTLAVQDGGRLKPLDTFARETARRVAGAKAFTGGESVEGLDPVEWIVAMVAEPDRWRAEPIVRVTHAGLRDALALPQGKDRYSFDELVGHERFLQSVGAIQERLRADRPAKPDPVEQEALELYETLSTMAGIFGGEAIRLVPRPGDAKAAWLSVADLGRTADPALDPVRSLVAAVVSAYRAGDRHELASSSLALGRRLREVAPDLYPTAGSLEREVHYNRLKPFRWSWILYLAAVLLLLAGFPLRSRAAGRAGVALAVAGFLLQTYGMVLRTLIAGRAPVTNMYESVVFVAWGAILLALIFEWTHPVRYVLACSAALAVLSLILADNLPILDGSIAPLVPVLRDNLWLTVHVLTVTLGYAAFLLAAGLGHLSLGLYFFAPERARLRSALSRFLYRSLQVGTLFLAAGTLLGGVWASYSWGRFWGWDPKETWALIALLGYLAVLHGRFVGWFKELGMAVGSIVGFLGVLMAWYGVNFILGTGLHSYGFGSGGYLYVGGFVAIEALILAAATVRYRRERARTARLPAVPELRTEP
jgi:cytochrome c-type biogenesis protein CcsB